VVGLRLQSEISFSAEKSRENQLRSATPNKLFGSAKNLDVSPSLNESNLRMMTPQTADANASQIKSASTL
jgi:hypothetical protein